VAASRFEDCRSKPAFSWVRPYRPDRSSSSAFLNASDLEGEDSHQKLVIVLRLKVPHLDSRAVRSPYPRLSSADRPFLRQGQWARMPFLKQCCKQMIRKLGAITQVMPNRQTPKARCSRESHSQVIACYQNLLCFAVNCRLVQDEITALRLPCGHSAISSTVLSTQGPTFDRFQELLGDEHIGVDIHHRHGGRDPESCPNYSLSLLSFDLLARYGVKAGGYRSNVRVTLLRPRHRLGDIPVGCGPLKP